MMRRILALSLLATFMRFSYEIPVNNADKLEVRPDAGVDIISPGYESGQYPYQTKKFWELYALNAKKIQVVFEDVDIEFHQSCLWDSVRIFRSKCKQSTSTSGGDAVLCGVLPTYKFDSDSSPICIMFTSDWYVNRRGFKAHARALSDYSENTTLVPNTSSSSSSSDVSKSVFYSTTSVSTQSTYVSNATSESSSQLSSSTSPLTQLSFTTLSLQASSSSSTSPSSSSLLSSSTTSTPTILFQPTSSQSSFLLSSLSLSTATTKSVSLLSSHFPSSTSKMEYSPSLSTSSQFKSVLNSTLLPSASDSFTSTPPLPSFLTLSPTLTSFYPSHSIKSSSSKILLTSSKSSSQHTTLTVTTSAPKRIRVLLCSATPTNIEIQYFDQISILSPTDDTGLKYPPNRHCVFTIHNKQLQDIHMMFINFDIEYSPNCAWDYFELKLGNNQPTRYCGNDPPQLENTQAEKILLVFHSDRIIHKKGFKMKLITPTHNSTRKDSSVDDTSTASPAETTSSFTNALISPIYSTAQEIGATKSYKTVNNTGFFEETDTPSPKVTPFSSKPPSPVTLLKSKAVFPSLSTISPTSTKLSTAETSTSFLSKRLHTIETGPITPTPAITEETPKNTQFYQFFTTTFPTSHTNDFSSINQSSSLSESMSSYFSKGTTQETTHKTSTESVKETLDIVLCEPNEISINIDNVRAITIRSPRDEITGKYPVNKHCVLTIDNPQQLVISFELEKCDIEYHPVCAWDYLLLKCDSEPEIRICGKQSPSIPESIASTVDIKFRSDMIVPSTGFVLKLTVHKPTLPTIASVSTQLISSMTSAAAATPSPLSTLTSEPTPSTVLSKSFLPTSSIPAQSSCLQKTSAVQSFRPIATSVEILPSRSTTSPTPMPSFVSTTSTQPTSSLTSSALLTLPSVPIAPFLPALSILSTLSSVKSASPLLTPIIISSTTISQGTLKLTTEGDERNSSIRSSTTESSSVSFVETTTPPSPGTLSKSVSEFITSFMSTSLPASSALPTTTSILTTSSVPKALASSTPPSVKSSSPLSFSPTVSSTTISEDLSTILSIDICDSQTMVDIENFNSIKIQSPEDGNGKYPLNEHCVLLVNNSRNEDIYIEVLEFNIEGNPSCSWDYLRVTIGDELPLVLCGSDIPNPILTQERRIEFVFHSDFMVSFKGFVMKLTKPSSERNGPVTGETTQSSNHTFALSDLTSTEGKTTEWPIALDEDLLEEEQMPEKPEDSGIAKTTVNVTNVQMESRGSSNQYQTTETSSEKHVSKIGNTSTTMQKPVVMQDSTTSTQEQTTVKWTTEMIESDSPTLSTTQALSSVTITGSDSDAFSSLKSVTTDSSVQTKITSSGETTVNQISDVQETSNPSTYLSSETTIKPSSSTIETMSTAYSSTGSVASSHQACSSETMPAVISGRFGLITSPGLGVDKIYPPLSTCMWHITRDKHKITLIIFEEFDIESSPGCLFDKLTFYEINGDGSRKETLTKLCGSDVPSTLSSRKDLLVEFQSDSVQERAGFKFQFMKVESESGVTYKCPPGKIPCMKDGTCIPIEWWCDGTSDCNDETDEIYCDQCTDDQLLCGDGLCIPASDRCNGIPQCSYNKDEQGCVSVTQENVQINIQGNWLPLCHNDVSVKVRDRLCQAAGYRSAKQVTGAKIQGQHYFSVVELKSGQLLFNESSVCIGHETARLQCSGSDCGRKGEHFRKKRIIGGSVSGKGEWPWSVVLRAGNTPICGGSIIDNRWILTAGHCVKDLVDNPQILSVITGVSDINDIDRQVRYVSEVILHPEYNFIFNADIALLRLQQPLVFDGNTKTICLPWDRRKFSPSDMCFITGYGVSDMKDYYTTVMPRYLRHVKTKIVNLDKCKAIYSSRFSTGERIKDNMICAGYTSGGMDACKGDSGGGLMCKAEDDRWTLAAVVSWGDMCGSTNRPGVYTNVVSFMDWILNKTDPNGVKNVTCDFEENGWCGYTDVSNGNYVWTRKPGDKYVKGTILYATKTSSANNKDKPMTASLLTPTFNTAGENCLSFSFMFSGNSNITLSVFGEENSEDQEVNKTLLWRFTSHYPAKDSWKSTEITLPAQYKQIRFESLSEHGGIVGLGLDNISMSIGQCSGSDFLKCTFNDGNMCKYEQYTGHNSKPWSFAANNNIAAMNSQQDLFIKAGGDFQTFGYPAMSKLISPKLTHDFTLIPHCVTFNFKKLAQTAHELVLGTYVGFGVQLINPVVFWNSENAETNTWLLVSTTIHHGVYNYIVFEVKRDYYSTEAIEVFLDDIHVTDGVCVN